MQPIPWHIPKAGVTPEPGRWLLPSVCQLNCPISRGMLSLDELQSFGAAFPGGEGPAVVPLLLSLLGGPGNASDAGILQEGALILLRHPRSPYIPGYCAYNQWEVCSQPQALVRKKGKQHFAPRELQWIQEQQENFRSKGMKGGTGQPNVSPGAGICISRMCCRSVGTETKHQFKAWCGAIPWIIMKGDYFE